MEAETQESAIGAPDGVPTHSQLAKDAPDTAISKLAQAIAIEAPNTFVVDDEGCLEISG
jgi:hypothetical protein